MPSTDEDNLPSRGYVGLDFDGTKLASALITESGVVAAGANQAVGESSVALLAERAIDALLQRSDQRIRLAGIGIGVPGRVDPLTGSVRHALNIDSRDDTPHPFPSISQAFDVPVAVEDDVNVAALGAFSHLRRTLPISSLVYLSIGTGVGVGVVLDGQLHRGSRGVVGEIGHLPVDPHGAKCPCGLRGCLETAASGRAIAQRWPTADSRRSAVDLFERSALGDEKAKAVADDVADHLAHAIHLLVVTLDVEMVVIGGGVADAGPHLETSVRSALERRGNASKFVRSFDLAKAISIADRRDRAVNGAALLAMNQSTGQR